MGTARIVPSYRSRHRDGLIAATVRVVTGTTCGTGFFVAPGLVVTCAHVVPDGPVTVLYGNDPYPVAEVLVREPANASADTYSYPDVALLRVPLTAHPCVPLDTGPLPAPGLELFAYGCPLIGGWPRWEHMPMSCEGERAGLDRSQVWIKTSRAQVQPGASGAGAVDERSGLLVGMLKLSRDPALDLGAVLVPTGAILAALTGLAGLDVLADNRAATQGYATVAAARDRLGNLLPRLAGHLGLASGIDPYHLRLMLLELADDPADPVEALDAALSLLHLELDRLGDALTQLARASRAADPPRYALETAAALAVVDGRSWVPPDAVAMLIAERSSAAPRVLQVRSIGSRSLTLHALRASLSRELELVPLCGASGETDPETGLPELLVQAVRETLLRKVFRYPADPADPAELARLWASDGSRALAKAADVLFVLPPEVADTAAVDALQERFRPCLFAIAAYELPGALRGHTRVLALPGSLSADMESAAEATYRGIETEIARAAGMRGT